MEKASNKNNYHYNKGLQPFAKANKKKLNRSAATMWSMLKGGKMNGYKFRRERPILNYIADFCCLELLLVIEVDGITHLAKDQIEKDKKRDEILESIGFTVLRFNSLDVLSYPEIVAQEILEWIETSTDTNSC